MVRRWYLAGAGVLCVWALLANGWAGVVTNPPPATDPFIHTDRNSPVVLDRPDASDTFSFAIFGDQTGTRDPAASQRLLQYAVDEMNLLGPDLVMTVGDKIQGYNQQAEWLEEMKAFHRVMKGLDMPWFPVAGNHDVYWQGAGRPANEHDDDYEKYFGPLWYAFEHKGCWFIVLYSDEGNPETGEKAIPKPESQVMSERQTAWLTETLKQAKQARHVFLFLHHPRWIGGGYGRDWDRIHALLKTAGNVSAVFAGHTHRMEYNGKRDGIEYFTLGTTGGKLAEYNPLRGQQHHYDWVTVRADEIHIAAFPVGSAIDPRVQRVETQVLRPWDNWAIKKEEQRLLQWPITVPDYVGLRGELRIAVNHTADDAGDKGLYYTLMDGQHRPIHSGFLAGTGTEWIKYPVTPGQAFFFTLSDYDTTFTGAKPGNKGKLSIELNVIRQEFVDPTLAK